MFSGHRPERSLAVVLRGGGFSLLCRVIDSLNQKFERKECILYIRQTYDTYFHVII